jgi:DNA-binding beta-propeller fold protein YncE
MRSRSVGGRSLPEGKRRFHRERRAGLWAAVVLALLLTGLGGLGAGAAASGIAGSPAHGGASAPVPALTAAVSGILGSARPAGSGSTYVVGSTVLGITAVRSQPSSATVDSDDNDLYVTNFGAPLLGGNTVSIVADTNDSVLTTVNVGDDPLSGLYAPSTGDVYILNFGTSNNLTVFHGTSIVKWIPTGFTPYSGLYDPADQWVYISNQASHNLTVINGTTTVGSVQVGFYPGVAAFDNRTDWLYVPNAGSSNVTIVNGSLGNGTSVVGSANVGGSPASAIYDASNGWVYVPNPGTNNVTILNGTTVVATVSGGGAPSYGAYDSQNGFVYLADAGTNTVYVLNGTSFVANISVGVYPRSVAFDPSDNLIYVPSWAGDSTAVINGTTVVATVAVGVNPYGLSYDPHVRSVYVLNFNSNNLSQIGTPSPSFPVTFNETGLPGGTAWTVDWNSTAYGTTNPGVGFPEANGTYNYTLSTVPGFSPIVPSARLTVAGHAVQANVTFGPAYPVTFAESGLPLGTFWGVDIGPVVNGTGNASLELWEPNGTYDYTVEPVAGSETTWFGNVTVAGLAVDVDVNFTTTTYPVWFNETGLPTSTLWGATLGAYTNTSTNSSFAFEAANGTYDYSLNTVSGYAGTPTEGRLSITGAVVTVRVAFVAAYPVTFEETGLPAGTNWTVTLGAGPVSSTAPNVTVERPNGTYSFSVSTSVFQYIPVASHGTFNVTGAPVNLTVAFVSRSSVETTFWLYFAESGLPSGTLWNVSLGNGSTTNASTTSAIGFLVTNATYSFVVAAVGYVPDPSHGLVVANGPASVSSPVRIAFQKSTVTTGSAYGVQFTAAGLPATFPWQVEIGNSTASGLARTLVLDEPNGSYTYFVVPVPGYVANGSGAVTVAGGPVLVVIDFHPFLSTVIFHETGLPAGAAWNVSLGTTPNSSTSSVVEFTVPNGTYTFLVGGPSGAASPSAGSVVVNGSATMIVDIQFGAPSSSAGTVFGLTPLEAVAVAALLAVVLVAVGLLAPMGRAPPDSPDDGSAAIVSSDDSPPFDDESSTAER